MAGATIKMAPNVPLPVRIKYIDVWPNDLTKNNGKGYGASISLKDEAGDRIYPKGFLNKVIQALVDGGVIEDGHYQHDPAEKYSIPVVNGNVTLLLDQPAGEKYSTFKVVNGNGKAPKPEGQNIGRLPNEEQETGAPPAEPVDARAEIFAAHSRCFKHVCDKYVPYAAEKGVELSLEGVSALTAHLWIELNKKGLA